MKEGVMSKKRRKGKKRTNPNRVPATKADLEKRARKAAEDNMIGLISLASMVLHDTEGFGPVRLERFILNFLEKLNDLESGDYYSLQDAQEWLKDYADIEVVEL